jgi:hypothetical protein
MAASAFSVQPQDAHAHDVMGAIDMHAAAAVRRLIEQFTNFSRPHGRLGLNWSY